MEEIVKRKSKESKVVNNMLKGDETTEWKVWSNTKRKILGRTKDE